MYIRQPLLNNHLVNNHLVNRNPHPVALQGIDIGIPLNIFSNIYTNLHYGFDITTTKSILLQFLLGYYAYGYDRIKDANEYSTSADISIYPQNKIDLYKQILDQKLLYEVTVNTALIASIYLLSIDNYDITHLPFLLLLYLSANYKEYKPLLSVYKPLYIAIMWTITTIGLPCVLHDNNYDILMYPQDYLSCLLFIFSASNFADINDIEEDKKLGVKTLPVLYGKQLTSYISFAAVAFAAILLVENPNFENRFWINSLIEAQHLGLMCVIYNNTIS